MVVAVIGLCCCVTLPHMSISTRVIVTIALQQVDDSPYGYTCADGGYDGFKGCYAARKKAHLNIEHPFYSAIRKPLNTDFSKC